MQFGQTMLQWELASGAAERTVVVPVSSLNSGIAAFAIGNGITLPISKTPFD